MQVSSTSQILPAITDPTNFYLGLQSVTAGRVYAQYASPNLTFNPGANVVTINGNLIVSNGIFYPNGAAYSSGSGSTYGNVQMLANLVATGNPITIGSNLTVGGNLSVSGNITGNTVMTTITEATVTNGSSGSTFTLSLANGTFQTITWTANCTVTMPAVGSGKSFTLLANTGTPGPYITTTFTGVRWPGGTAPTITATANKADVFSFISDGVYWYGFYNQNY